MRPIFRSALGAVLLLLAGCSDTGGHAGIEGTGDTVTAAGTVTAFGSIYVNGIHFETDFAAIEINDQPGREDQLHTGMVVYVEGNYNSAQQTGDATLVRYRRILKGPVASIDEREAAYISVTILGQTVRISDESDFSNVALYNISVGDELAISGYIGGEYDIAATYVAEASSSDPVEVEGRITAVDPSLMELTLNGQLVLFAQATINQGAIEELTPGRRIEVIGQLDNEVIKATSIRLHQSAPRIAGGLSVLEGVVAELDSNQSFYLEGVLVNAGNALFPIGSAESLEAGKRVIVRGRYDAAGTLQAEALNLFDENSNRFTGAVEDVNPSTGEITVAGDVFTTTAFTAFDDKTQMPERYFNLDNISAGDQVVVFAVAQGEQRIATRIRRTPAASDTEIHGTVDSFISSVEFSVSGVMVHAQNVHNPEVLKTLYPGKFVSVDGHYTGIMHFEATGITVYKKRKCDDYWDKHCSR